MSIINHFPVGNMELAVIYDLDYVFPAFIHSMSNSRIETNRSDTLNKYVYGYGESDTETRYECRFIFYPARTFYIEPSTNDNTQIAFEPGHVYDVSHLTYDESAQSQGYYIIKKDNVTIYEKRGSPYYGVTHTQKLFSWSYSNN